MGQMWSDPVTETPRAGSTEIWNIFNLTGDAHPIHVHLVEFQVLSRQALLTDSAGNPLPQVDPSAPVEAPDANERPAYKDTVKTYPGKVTRIISKFDLPSNANVRRGDKLRYVWHCHILDHEDNEMMRPYDVIA
jgi:spore coat protein A